MKNLSLIVPKFLLLLAGFLLIQKNSTAQTFYDDLTKFNSTTKKVYCYGENINLTVDDETDVTFEWKRYKGIGVGGDVQILSSTTHELTDKSANTVTSAKEIVESGYYTYVVTATNKAGCINISDPILIYVLPKIKVTVADLTNATFCEGTLPSGKTLTATVVSDPSNTPTSTDTYAYKYKWFKGSVEIGTGSTYTLVDEDDNTNTTNTALNVTYRVEVSYAIKDVSAECTSSASSTITLTKKPSRPIIRIN